jgi:hypothetical protein
MKNSNTGTAKTPATATADQSMSRMRTSTVTGTTNDSGRGNLTSSMYMAERFPVNTLQQITIGGPNEEIVTGRVYCTDEMTRTVVLQKALTHTTLSSEIRIISMNSILRAQQLHFENDSRTNSAAEKNSSGSGSNNGRSNSSGSNKTSTTAAVKDTEDMNVVQATPLTQPLPIIQKKVLEERERRAMRQAEESLRHINTKVSVYFSMDRFDWWIHCTNYFL